jgi:hypothetical protein
MRRLCCAATTAQHTQQQVYDAYHSMMHQPKGGKTASQAATPHLGSYRSHVLQQRVFDCYYSSTVALCRLAVVSKTHQHAITNRVDAVRSAESHPWTKWQPQQPST